MASEIIWCVVFALIVQSCCTTSIHIESVHNNESGVIIECLEEIIKTHIIYTPTIILSDGDKREPTQRNIKFYDKLIDIVVKYNIPKVNNLTVGLYEMYVWKDHYLSISYFYSCDVLLKRPIASDNPVIKHIVIIFNSSEACTSLLKNGMSYYVSKYDVTLLKLKHDGNYDIITYIPEINPADCILNYNVSHTTIATCKAMRHRKVNIFPNKEPQNLMGCVFKVGMSTYVPFSKIKNSNSLQLMDPIKEIDINGCDVAILKIMSEYLNFTLQYYFIFNSEGNSRSRLAFLDFLLNGTLDACAGGLYRIYGDIVEYSGVYGRQAFVWMYTVKRRSRSWQHLIARLSNLYVFIVYYVCYSLISFLHSKYDKKAVSFSSVMLYNWGALTSASLLYKPKSFRHKIMNFFYVVLCTHFSIHVNIHMYSFLTVIGPPVTYKTNNDIYESNLQPYMNMGSRFFIDDKQYQAFANTSKECTFFEDCEFQSLKHNGITIVVDGQFTLFQAETIVDGEARALKVPQNMLTVYHEILIRRNVSITRSFQKLMTRLGEAGITDRLYHEALGILTEAKVLTATKNIMSYSYSCRGGCSITLIQCGGAFYVWMFGCAVSLCVFLWEIIGKKEQGHQT